MFVNEWDFSKYFSILPKTKNMHVKLANVILNCHLILRVDWEWLSIYCLNRSIQKTVLQILLYLSLSAF